MPFFCYFLVKLGLKEAAVNSRAARKGSSRVERRRTFSMVRAVHGPSQRSLVRAQQGEPQKRLHLSTKTNAAFFELSVPLCGT